MNQQSEEMLRAWTKFPAGSNQEKSACFDKLKPLVPELLIELAQRGEEITELKRKIEGLEFDRKNLVALAERRAEENKVLAAEYLKRQQEHQTELRANDARFTEITAEADRCRRRVTAFQDENKKLRAVIGEAKRALDNKILEL